MICSLGYISEVGRPRAFVGAVYGSVLRLLCVLPVGFSSVRMSANFNPIRSMK